MTRAFFTLLSGVALSGAAPVALFDGKSLEGWEIRKGEEKWWRVEDGMIVGGSLTEAVPFNTFLASRNSYGDFELTYEIRLVKGEGFMNSGMQVRSQRVTGNSEMAGYQVDAGVGYWGDLYDESRRNIAVAKGNAPAAKDWEWNQYRVLCEGSRVRSWINGTLAFDYTEADPAIPRDGLIGLQAHGGGKFLVQLRKIAIERAETDGNDSRSAQEELAGFKVPEDFNVELVASEEQGVGKPITVAWDRHGRMWTTTALEYPVDGNENEAFARELYEKGGKDRVLVFDEPNQAGPLTPRVFAEGLAIPLGVLPVKDEVLVHHGPQIRRYFDKNKDGKADGFDIPLAGFGVQDSHLMPHQFERAPGGWIYLAQGAFNASKVHRPDGKPFADGAIEVIFNNCKLARFKADGSEFQPLTGGPNNIWGLAMSRTGRTFVQEANDMGFPVAEFEPGTHYPTPFGPKMREDAPVLPPSTPGQPMGGTGLSGIALADDLKTPFARRFGAGNVFYLANPITSKIQIVTMTMDESGHPVYRKGQDFLTSADPQFRPIATHFGPDGCLYVVDWYNKIISHNEVPRNHPDRDKTHGRIWRIRHRDQATAPQVDLATLADSGLIDLLGGANSRLSSMAWQEIADRNATGLKPQLVECITDSSQPVARRTAALWALEGLHLTDAALLAGLAASPEPDLRYQAVRIAGECSLPDADFLQIIGALGDETHYRVRAAIANAVRDHRSPTPAILACAARLGLPPMTGDSRAAYDRTFERYLARWAMSGHPDATRKMIESIELSFEARLLAMRSLDPASGAAAMVKVLPEIARPLTADELGLLGNQLSQPDVLAALTTVLQQPASRRGLLETMLQLDPQVAANPALRKAVSASTREMLARDESGSNPQLAVRLARRFRLKELAPEVESWMEAAGRTDADLAQGLSTLRESGATGWTLFRSHLDHADEGVRREAVIGFGMLDAPEVVTEFATRWAGWSGAFRSLAVTGMTSSPDKAQAFAQAISLGDFPGFDATAIEKLIAALGVENPVMKALLVSHKGLLRPVLVFRGSTSGRVETHLTLDGPFTVETWIKLAHGISNDDGILGHEGGVDFNFYGSKLRVFGGNPSGDVVISNHEILPNVWTHCAITRDSENLVRIYLNGELDAVSPMAFPASLDDLNLGETHRGQLTAASFDEVRIWNIARDATEIRRNFQTSLTGDPKPLGLVNRITGDDPKLKTTGDAHFSLTMDFPHLISTEDSAALEAKFHKYRGFSEQSGEVAAGHEIARHACMICHQIQGEGNAIGPNLSGAGAMGTEALLRNILTPNAQLESGYYRHDIRLRDGTVLSGFMVGETENSLTLRPIGADEKVIPRADVLSHEISRRSLMPEGLIDGFSAQQASDLFAYLKTLQ